MISVIRSDPELNDYDHTYVHVENVNVPDDQTLSTPMFSIVFHVLPNYYPRGTIRSSRNRFIYHDTTEYFEYPIHCFWSPSNAKNAILEMLSRIEIPFRWDNNFFWKEWRRKGGVFALPLNCVCDMVARVLELGCLMIGLAALTGRKRLRMVVTIERRMSVPRRDYEVIVWARQDLEATEGYENMMPAAVFDDNWTELGCKPEAKSAAEALRSWEYLGSSSDQSRIMCSISTEEVKSGFPMICMPCSSMFHGDCILEWLEKNHTCPLCRFSLPNY